jgi:hypothetical protein
MCVYMFTDLAAQHCDDFIEHSDSVLVLDRIARRRLEPLKKSEDTSICCCQSPHFFISVVLLFHWSVLLSEQELTPVQIQAQLCRCFLDTCRIVTVQQIVQQTHCPSRRGGGLFRRQAQS